MTSEAKPRIKITYATLRPTTRTCTAGFEAAVERGPGRARARITGTTSTARGATATATFEVRSPIDRDIVLGTFARGTTADIDDAVAAARAAQPAWAATPWRSASRSCAAPRDLISDRLMELVGAR